MRQLVQHQLDEINKLLVLQRFYAYTQPRRAIWQHVGSIAAGLSWPYQSASIST
jgi:hypothetical protein